MPSVRGSRGTRAGQADHRRAELLEAARRVVAARGLAATRVADIAKEVNVSGGLIHYHFATKDDLITAMLQATLDEEVASLAAITGAPAPPPVRLDGVLRYYLPNSRADDAWVLWLDAWTVARREPAVAEIVRGWSEAWISALERVILDGVESGEFTCSDPYGAAERVDAMLDGLVLRYSAHPSVLSRQRLLDHARTAAAREVGVPASALGKGPG